MIDDFGVCELVTADRLNELVDALNNWEFLVNFPVPGFNGVILDKKDNAGGNNGEYRSWRYLIQHRSENRYVHIRFKWLQMENDDDGHPPHTAVYVDEVVAWTHTAAEGITDVLLDTNDYSFVPGQEYVVRVWADRKNSKEFKLFWVFESET